MARTIDDVNDMLFQQMENLQKDLIPSKLEQELLRTKALINASGEIGRNLKLKIEAMKVSCEGPYNQKNIPEDFCINPEQKKP